MDDAERRAIEADITRAIYDYWDEVDSRWGAKAHEMYTEDGQFGKRIGRDEIKAFYDWRKTRGDRSTFHLALNVKVDVESKDKATARYIMMLYGVDGVPPLPIKAPNTIYNAVEEFVRQPSGWMLKSKMTYIVFEGEEPATIMPDSILENMRKK